MSTRDRIYLDVPYEEISSVKNKGGKFDNDKRKWYILDNNPEKDKLCEQYNRISNETKDDCKNKFPRSAATDKRIYLKVPYMQKDQVKEQGGKWDPTKKKWYISSNHPNCQTLRASFS